MDLRGRRALVTGASGGIGTAFARRLASLGADLVVTGRREDRLRALAAELGPKHRVEVVPIVADLLDREAPAMLFRETEEAGRPVDVLINNAGFASYGNFPDIEWTRLDAEVRLGVLAMTEMAHRFARPMRDRGRGYILNMGSIAAYTPTPYLATYAAGKAYVRFLSEALAHELAPAGVRVCCICPGATRTDWFERSGQRDLALVVRATMGTPERVAGTGLRALFGRRHNVLVGATTKLAVFLTRLAPMRLVVSITAKVVQAER